MGSPGVRQFFSLYLPAFHKKYPDVTIDIRPRHWPETSITGIYRDGSEKSYSIKYLSPMGIHIRAHRLVNEGNQVTASLPFSAAHMHYQRRSIQGVWNPWLWSFESTRTRSPWVPRWDRKLTEKEWRYYLDHYTTEMKAEEQAIKERVDQYSEIPEEHTREVRARWKAHVMPTLQTDMEHNLQYWKEQHAKGQPGPHKTPPTLEQYMLFAVPEHTVLGQDAVDMLRRREAQDVEEWWKERGNQLKPP